MTTLYKKIYLRTGAENGSAEVEAWMPYESQPDGSYVPVSAAELTGDITVGEVNQGAAGTEDWKMTLDSEVVAVDATGQGDVPVTLDGETVVLGAGSAAIGKLGANSGVDIGDVDVTSLPSSIQGPGNPTVDSYASAAISASANTANQSVIAAPGASKQIWVYAIFGLADTGDGSIAFQDEDDTALTGVMPVAENGGFSAPPSGNFSMPYFKVPTNKALEIDTVTCGFKGLISYAIVSV